jgi:hypothetical protein
MSLTRWVRNLLLARDARQPAANHHWIGRHRAAARARPSLEVLEDRLCLSAPAPSPMLARLTPAPGHR